MAKLVIRRKNAVRKVKKPELEIVIQLRGEVTIELLNKFIEKRIMQIYEKHPYAKIRIEVLA